MVQRPTRRRQDKAGAIRAAIARDRTRFPLYLPYIPTIPQTPLPPPPDHPIADPQQGGGMGGMGGMGLGGMGLGGMGMMNPMMNPMMMGMGMNPMMMGGMGGMGMMNPMMMGGMGMMNPTMMGMGGMGMLGGGLGSGAYGDALVLLDAKVSPWRTIWRLRHGHGSPADGPRNGHGWVWVWDGRDALGILRGKWVAEEVKEDQPGASIITLPDEDGAIEEKSMLSGEEEPVEEEQEDSRTDTSAGGRIATL